jgi:hypothetical protein
MEAPDQLLANPRNWRVHPQHQVDALEGLLSAVGWVQRVIVNRTTGHVVDGHARVALGLRRSEPEVPVLYVELSEAEEQLVLAALDPIAGLAGTDQALLDGLLEDVAGGNAALDEFLAGLKSEDAPTRGLTDPDDAPPVQAEAVSKPGDVWALGRHRIICGSSTDAQVVQKLLGGGIAAPDGDGPALWCRVLGSVAERGNASQERPEEMEGRRRSGDRRRPERWERRLARGLGAVPWRCCLCLARRQHGAHRG